MPVVVSGSPLAGFGAVFSSSIRCRSSRVRAILSAPRSPPGFCALGARDGNEVLTRARSHARANWAGVTCFVAAISFTRSTSSRFFWKFSPLELPRPVATPVVLWQILEASQLAGEESAAERVSTATKPMPNSRTVGSEFVPWVAAPQRILGLQGGDRVYGMRPADGRGRRLAQAEVTHLPCRTSSAISPTVSSMGTSGSTRCW